MIEAPSVIYEAMGELPPAPPLDVRWLSCHRESDVDGALEAFVPATPAYVCNDSQAPALVCLPGLGIDGTCFLRQLPLGVRADLHLLRMPGYAVKGEHGLGHFARYVERYIRKLQLEGRGVVLLGSSMGGAVALTVAARRKVEVRGLVLVGTFGHHRHLTNHQQVLTHLSWVLPWWLIRLFAGPMLRKTKGFGDFSKGEAEYMLTCLRVPSQGYLVRAAEALRQLDLLGQARSLTVPALVLHGTDDHVLPCEAGRELARTIPDARMVVFDGGSHAVFFLEHEAVNDAVAGFLREVCNVPVAKAQTA